MVELLRTDKPLPNPGSREIDAVPSDTLKWVYMGGGRKEFPDWMKPKPAAKFEDVWGV